MANEKQLNLPDLGTLVKAGRNAGAAAKPIVESKPETIDLSSVGGKLIGSPQTSSEPVDLSSLYGERGGFLQTQTTADEPTKE